MSKTFTLEKKLSLDGKLHDASVKIEKDGLTVFTRISGRMSIDKYNGDDIIQVWFNGPNLKISGIANHKEDARPDNVECPWMYNCVTPAKATLLVNLSEMEKQEIARAIAAQPYGKRFRTLSF